MGIVIEFPTESAKKRASIEPEEPARVITLPVPFKAPKAQKLLLLVPPAQS